MIAMATEQQKDHVEVLIDLLTSHRTPQGVVGALRHKSLSPSTWHVMLGRLNRQCDQRLHGLALGRLLAVGERILLWEDSEVAREASAMSDVQKGDME